jgi:hypothetical protein
MNPGRSLIFVTYSAEQPDPHVQTMFPQMSAQSQMIVIHASILTCPSVVCG